MFWSEYTDFNHKNGPFDCYKFTWIIKDIRDGNGNFLHNNYSLPFTNVLGFVSCRVTSKVFVIDTSEFYLGDLKTIKSDKRYDNFTVVS